MVFEELYKVLKKNKPNLSESTYKNYISVLYNLYKKIRQQYNVDSIDQLLNLFCTVNGQKDVIQYLEQIPFNRRKTLIATILALCDSKNQQHSQIADKYRVIMLSDINMYNQHEREQTKSDTERNNWLSWNDILQIRIELEDEVAGKKLWTRPKLSIKDYNTLQSYIIISFYTLIPPRRIKDYIDLVVESDDTMNYITEGNIVFNSYKTKNTYDQQIFKLPKNLLKLYKRWIQRKKEVGVESQYVFSKYTGEKFSQPQFTTFLQKIFNERTGKKVSVNLLRHAFVSDVVLKDMPDLNSLDDKAEQLGHSTSRMMLYKKT